MKGTTHARSPLPVTPRGWPNSNRNRWPNSLWIRRPTSLWKPRPNSFRIARPIYVGIRTERHHRSILLRDSAHASAPGLRSALGARTGRRRLARPPIRLGALGSFEGASSHAPEVSQHTRYQVMPLCVLVGTNDRSSDCQLGGQTTGCGCAGLEYDHQKLLFIVGKFVTTIIDRVQFSCFWNGRALASGKTRPAAVAEKVGFERLPAFGKVFVFGLIGLPCVARFNRRIAL